MKKRLLITSIVMMLVVAVALSTATYAWFTSNASVTATGITLTAASNQAPSLGINWIDNDNTYGASITATYPTAQEKVFFPAAPATLTNDSTTSTVVFNTALAAPKNNVGMVFAANGAATDVYTWTDGTNNSFYLKNLSPSFNMTSVTMSATISGDGAGLIRVGVFKHDSVSNTFKLVGVLANEETGSYTQLTGDDTMDGSKTYYKLYLGKYIPAVKGTSDEVTAHTADWYDGMKGSTAFFSYTSTGTSAAQACYGDIVKDAPVNNMSSTACVTSINLGGLSAGGKVQLVVKVWEDAVALGDAQGGQAASIALSFTAA